MLRSDGFESLRGLRVFGVYGTQGDSITCNTHSKSQKVPLPNEAASSCAKHVLEITFGIENLIKEFEKSMSCSMVTLYYFEPQK